MSANDRNEVSSNTGSAAGRSHSEGTMVEVPPSTASRALTLVPASAPQTSVTSSSPAQARQPQRMPRDMQGLLRFCIQATTVEDAPQASTMEPLDEERKTWLEDALKNMSVDVIETMMTSVQVIKNSGKIKSEDEAMECLRAIETITDHVGSMDMANNFHKIGGFIVLQPALNSTFGSVRSEGANLIAELTQNNPYCQNEAVKSGLVPLLVKMLDSDPNEEARVKALYALSCIVRDNSGGLTAFTDSDGFSVLLRAMQSDVEKLKVKASFMLSVLCTQQPEINNTLYEMGFVEQLVALIQRDHDVTHEHMVSALLSLVQNHYEALGECQRPELNLQSTLEERMRELEGKEEFKEEAEYCKVLLDCCFCSEVVADR